MIKTLFNFVRGLLIGIAEVIPGVSGGTIALITGIYNRLLNNADLVFKSFLNISKPSRVLQVFKKLEWSLLIPVLVGMAIALVLGAKFIEPLLETNPIELRARRVESNPLPDYLTGAKPVKPADSLYTVLFTTALQHKLTDDQRL